jgi:hypothetical protein
MDVDWPEFCLEQRNEEPILSAVPAIKSVTMPVVSRSPVVGKSAKAPQQSLGFSDLLAAINPLQHIPIIGSIYRAITGDTMSPTAEIVGGALFGGIVGAMSSLADVVFAQATGKSVGDTVLAWLGFDTKPTGTTQFAKANLPSTPATPPPSISAAPASDRALARRAAFAYQRASTLQTGSHMPGLSLNY